MAKESVTEIQVGRTAFPFENQKDFLAGSQEGLTQLYSHRYRGEVVVLNQSLDFEGVKGQIEAFHNKDQINKLCDFPLGPVPQNILFSESGTQVMLAPLQLRIGLQVKSEDQLELVFGHTPAVGIGSKRYYLRYQHHFALVNRALESLHQRGQYSVSGTVLVAQDSFLRGIK